MFITRKDYRNLRPVDALKYDKRSFCRLMYEYLFETNAILILSKTSIQDPLWKRIMMFFFKIILVMTTGALFFTDAMIQERSQQTVEERVSISI